jgi:hypothetical protein
MEKTLLDHKIEKHRNRKSHVDELVGARHRKMHEDTSLDNAISKNHEDWIPNKMLWNPYYSNRAFSIQIL